MMKKKTKKKKTTAEMVVMEAPVILEVVATAVEVKATAMLEVAEVLATAEVFGGKNHRCRLTSCQIVFVSLSFMICSQFLPFSFGFNSSIQCSFQHQNSLVNEVIKFQKKFLKILSFRILVTNINTRREKGTHREGR